MHTEPGLQRASSSLRAPGSSTPCDRGRWRRRSPGEPLPPHPGAARPQPGLPPRPAQRPGPRQARPGPGAVPPAQPRRRAQRVAGGGAASARPPLARPSQGALAGGPAVPKARSALCLALAALFWLLNTTWSRPLWEGLPLLAVLQFPWRLYGPLALALAFAGAGIFAWLAGRGQQQWLLALLLAAFVVVNGRAGHTWERPAARPGRRCPRWLPGCGDAGGGHRLGRARTSGGEFLPRSVVLPDATPRGWSWKVAYEALYPAGGWIAGRVWPLSADVEVRQVWDAPPWTVAQVEVGGRRPGRGGLPDPRLPRLAGLRRRAPGRPPRRPLTTPPWPWGTASPSSPSRPACTTSSWPSAPPGRASPATLLTIAGLGAGGAWLARGAGRRRRLALGRPAGGHRRLSPPVAGAGYLLIALLPALAGPPGSRDRRAPAHRPRPGRRRARRGRGCTSARRTGNALGELRRRAPGDDRGAPPALALHAPPGRGARPPGRPAPGRLPGRARRRPPGLGGAGGGRGALHPGGGRPRHGAGGTRHARTLLDEVLQPQVRPQDRGWRFAEVDLAPYAGQRVTLILRTEGRDTPLFDWAGWATPAVYVDRSGRYPPPAAIPLRARLRALGGARGPAAWRPLG